MFLRGPGDCPYLTSLALNAFLEVGWHMLVP
jgi:hypothetical protein